MTLSNRSLARQPLLLKKSRRGWRARLFQPCSYQASCQDLIIPYSLENKPPPLFDLRVLAQTSTPSHRLRWSVPILRRIRKMMMQTNKTNRFAKLVLPVHSQNCSSYHWYFYNMQSSTILVRLCRKNVCVHITHNSVQCLLY